MEYSYGWNIRMVTFGWFIWLLSVGLCWYPFDICVLWLLDVLGNRTRPWEPNGELLDSGRMPIHAINGSWFLLVGLF